MNKPIREKIENQLLEFCDKHGIELRAGYCQHKEYQLPQERSEHV